jgi:hypothetical protein
MIRQISSRPVFQGLIFFWLIGLIATSHGVVKAEDPSVQPIEGPRLFSPNASPLRESAPTKNAAPLIRLQPRPLPFAQPSQDDVPALKAEVLRLKVLLQQMELDRLRALHSKVPTDEANALRESIWPSSIIEVTWENPELAPEEERAWVREAVRETWEAESSLQFTNWGKASGDSQRGIRIKIDDVGPYCANLGSKLDGVKDGMVLNFTFRNWCPQCVGLQANGRKFAIKAVAAHEFGHAIGFAHEQNRNDAPQLCQMERQGGNGDWYVTIYDPKSIMNYCNTNWNNGGLLSELDKLAVRTIYGSRQPMTPAGAAK